MVFRRFTSRRFRERAAHGLYVTIIEQSRRPFFYMERGVPDSLDGRFDLIVLHASAVMRRLRSVAAPRTQEARDLSQALFDLMFQDMDQNLREMGVSDMSVGKRVKQMAKAFYGRASAYEEGLAGGNLEAALARNLYGTLDGEAPAAVLAGMAVYLRACTESLSRQADGDLLAGQVIFPVPDGAAP